jgi:hypothetical protein
MTHNHFGNYTFAKEHLIKAYLIFKELDDTEYIIFTLTVLILGFANTRDLDNLAVYHKQLLKYSPISEHTYYLIQQAMLLHIYISKKNNHSTQY